MELELSGRKALVTGSSRGIGRAIAEALQDEGCSVALNARNETELKETARELGCTAAVAGDVSNAEEARRVVGEAVAALGGLDILVCNVGSGRSVAPGNETYEEWQRVFALNLWSTTNVVEAARSELADAHGVVVCISSLCGLEVIPGAPVTYSTAKAALHAYVRGIARPLGAQGVRINAIAAGNIFLKVQFGHESWRKTLQGCKKCSKATWHWLVWVPRKMLPDWRPIWHRHGLVLLPAPYGDSTAGRSMLKEAHNDRNQT